MPFLLTHPLAKGSGDVLQALPASRSSGISSALCFPAAHQAADSSRSTAMTAARTPDMLWTPEVRRSEVLTDFRNHESNIFCSPLALLVVFLLP